MTEPRSHAASALLQDGRILIAGGDSGSGPVASAEFFDTTGAFAAAPPMSMPRSAHSATVLADGRILVAGGVTGAAATNSAEIFDPLSNAWAPVPGGMIQARSNHTASLLSDGRVLFAGGENAGSAIALLEVFDPVTGSFSSVGAMSTPRKSFASAVLQDGRVLLIGGSNDSDPLASTEIFDPQSNSIAAGPVLSAPRMNHSATTLLNGQVLVAGGSTVTSNPDGSTSSVDLASAEIYDPAAGNFAVSASSLAAPRRDHGAFLLPNNNSVLIVGGTSAGNEVATAELFVPSNGIFATTGAPLVARQHAVGASLKQDGILLLAGGSNSTGTLASTELYGFATVKTDAQDYAPGTVVTITGAGWQPGETVTLTLVESPLVDTHPVMTAVADSSGKITNTDFSPDSHDVNIRFYLTAVGQTSSQQAQNTFTDGNATSVSGTVRSSAAGNPAIGGATITCSSGCNNGATTTSAANGSYVFNNTTTKLSFGGNGPVTLNLTASAPGFDPATITLTNVNNGDNLTGKDFSLTPSTVVTTTVVTSSLNPSSYGQSVTFSATVSPNAGSNGTVTFKDSANTICTAVALSGSVATCPISSLSAASHSITAVYSGGGSFLGSSSAALSQVVNSKALTITGVTVNSRTYDGTTNATLNNSAAVLNGAVTGETLTLNSGSSSATFATKNVGTGIAATASGYTFTATPPALATNYTLSQPSGLTGNITTAPLTATLTAADRAYNGTNAEPDGSMSCVVATVFVGDTLNCTATSGTFNGKDVATANQVTATVTISGSSATNYTLGAGGTATTSTTATATAHITSATVIPAITADDRDYDGTTAATIHCTLTGVLALDSGNVLCNGTGNFADANAGTKVVTSTDLALSGGASGNYMLSTTTATATATIRRKSVIPAITAGDKDYDGTTTATIHCTLTGVLALDSGNVLCNGTGNFADANAGTKVVTSTDLALSGGASGNYMLSTATATATATIRKKSVTPAITADDKDYDGTTAATIHCTLTGVLALDSGNVLCGGTGNFADANAGTKTVTSNNLALSAPASGNYMLSTMTATATATIRKKSVTATLAADNKVYDGNVTEPDAMLHCVLPVGSAVGSDDVACSASGGTFNSKDVTTATTVTASVALTGNTASNYSLTSMSVTAAAHITARPITVTATVNTKVYDGTLAAAAVPMITAGTLAAGDSPNFTEAYGVKDVGAGLTLTPSGAVSDGNSGQNYAVTFVATANGIITARPIAVTADAKSKVFGTTDPPLTYMVTSGSLVSGDSFSGNLSRASGENAGTYAILQGSLTAGTNYMLTFAGANLTITQASSSTTIVASPNPSQLGQSVTFTATVVDSSAGSAGTPTGTATFKDGATTIGSGILNGSGQAMLTVSSLTVGPHSITAVYGGDLNFVMSSSVTPVSQQVSYGFLGFQAPYAPPPTTFNVTRTMPLKWQYTNSSGNVVNSAAANPVVTIQGPYACGATDSAGTITVNDAGSSGYQYDPGSNGWQFNWQIKGNVVGCYDIYVTSQQSGQRNGPFPISVVNK
ncbi:MAG TPA: YDG domain-containing protein [Candidatus Acidoferrum sp.]